ncbi:MAG: ThiF family adenylyltransferase [Planctomycetes bacterium]|nr:ThiF family adenylyltransferase [Planctomycetota bacterium]
MNNRYFEERYSRQHDIVPAERLASCKASVIGVGAIGRQVALQLVAMGIPRLQLVDFDVVETSNLASQGYLESDLGKPKVEATAELCRQINSTVEILPFQERFRRSMDVGNMVFCAVDNIDMRRLIWDSVKKKANCFCDGRMTAETLRVLTACDYESRRHYPTTLFRSDEAFAGPCTAKTTIYCANIAAGLMVAQFTKYLRQLPVDCDIQLNLLASEMSVAENR